ncbi:MAG: Omp28-related outer membrane protein [Bacteroidota bacterium]
MKSVRIFFSISTLLVLFGACQETPPLINYKPSNSVLDTTFITSTIPAAESKNILIEDFTGVGCVNCPRAHDVLKALKLNNPGRVFSIANHPLNATLKTLTEPINKPPHVSKQDYRTKDADDLLSYLGSSNSLPTGSINRKLFSGETKWLVSDLSWSGYATTELAQTSSAVNMDSLSIKYDASSNELIMDVRLVFTQSMPDSQYLLTVAILENKIIDIQEKNENGNTIYIEDYEHDNLLRKVITGVYGDLLKAKYEPGRVFRKRFIYKPTADELKSWNTDNLAVIAFVHGNATKKDVIQVKAVSIKP